MTKNKADISLQLPFRFSKPREQGLTIIADPGFPSGMLESVFENFSAFIDMGKLSSGTAYLDPSIQEKVALYRRFEIEPYFSGTLFEKFYLQDNIDGYIEFLKQMGMKTVEIADSAVLIPLEQRLEIIGHLAKEFKVIGKVGSKDSDSIVSPSEWVEQMTAYLNAGCEMVVAEGRREERGLYRPNGEIRQGLVADIVKAIDESKVIFEASHVNSQGYFIKLLGANVNLGNVSGMHALTVESLRSGLLFETLNIG